MLSMLSHLSAVVLLAVLVPLAAIPRPSSQAVTDARINLAGRQHMLIQRMAKASYFVMIGIAPAGKFVESKTAADEFARTLHVLRFEDSAPGFKSGNNIAVIEALDGADLLWQTYGLAIRQLYSQDRHNVVVSLIEFHHVDFSAPDARATTVKIAGRQWMLSQRIAKELCLIFAGVQNGTHQTLVAGSGAQFDAALEVL